MTTTQHLGKVFVGTKAERLAFNTTKLNYVLWVQLSGDTGDPALFIWTGSEWQRFAATGLMRLGEITAAGTPESAGYGMELFFSGGPQFGTWDSENSDPLWVARYNVATDETELHINIGDNPAAVDAVVMGYTDGGVWYPVHRFGNDGSLSNPYGEIYVEGIAVDIALAAQDTYYQVEAWSPGGPDGIDGEALETTPDVSNDHITIAQTGIYLVRWHVGCYSGQSNIYEFEVFVNNGTGGFPNTENYRTTSVASAIGAVSGGGLCSLTAADTVELWVERKDGAGVSKTVTIRAATLTVLRVG